MGYKIVGGLVALEMLASYLKQKDKPPSIRGVVETVHSLPGRMRLSVPSLVNDAEQAANLQASIGSLEAVAFARVSPVTGSVVVCFDPSSVEPILLFGAVIRILGLDHQMDSASQPVLWREIDSAGKTADDLVRTLSIGLMDVKTLITLSFAGVVAYRFFSGRTNLMLPGTATLMWWIANLVILRGLK